MPAIITRLVYCPLCNEQMKRRELLMGGKRAVLYYCRLCEIGVYDFDPAFNKWRDADKAIPCSTCGKPLNWFARYMDGYFKAVCPSCGTKLEKDGDVRFKKSGAIVIPDEMEEDNAEEPVRVTIPVHKLKGLGRDQQDALRRRLSRGGQRDAD